MKRLPRPLQLEPLEDRTLLATCHVTRLSDAGAGFGFRGDLRYCINKVNTVPGPDTIDFTVTGTIALASPLPELATEIDIVGPGATELTVRRAGGSNRIFAVGLGASVRISGLTATNGYLSNGDGGGIHNRGTLSLIGVRVFDNHVQHIGSSPRAYGGGIYNEGTLVVSDSVISDNTAEAGHSISSGDAFAYGGGIYNLGVVTIVRSTIADNFAYAYAWPEPWVGVAGGGGISGGSVSIVDSTISGNSASGASGNDSSYAVGGGISSGATLTISNSTVTGNNADCSCWGDGPDGIMVFGTATITHSTIAGNTFGGGIRIIQNGGSLTLRDTVVANNGSEDVVGMISNSGYNLIENPSAGSGYVPSDILDVDPMLGPLADNGGLTLTMALLPGSPAIDSGDNTGAPEWDQRGPGFPRIVNGTIDRGAFEVQSTPAPTAPDYLAVLITADFKTDD